MNFAKNSGQSLLKLNHIQTFKPANNGVNNTLISQRDWKNQGVNNALKSQKF